MPCPERVRAGKWSSTGAGRRIAGFTDPEVFVRALLFVATLAIPAMLVAQTPVSPAASPPASAMARDRVTTDLYLEWEDVQDPRLSPDGKQIVFTRRWVDKLNDKWENSLWLMNADGSRARFLLNGSSPQWSPDGSRITYMTRAESSSTQIFVRWMDAEGAMTQLTRLTETPSDLRWSPDGKWVSFRMIVPARNDLRIDMPAAPRGAKWTEAPRQVSKLNYRRDREGFIEEGNRHIFVISADGGTPRQVTTGAFDHGPAEWMADGKSLVFSGLREPDAEYRWRESEIYAVDVATGATRQLTMHAGPDGNATPSPDGRLIAFTSMDSTSDTWRDSRLFVMNADGSGRKSISESLDRSPNGLMWAHDGSGVYFNVENEGSRNLYFASVAGQVKQVTTGKQVLSVSDIAGALAVGVMSTSSHPNDIVAIDLRAPAPKWLTAVNEDVLSGKTLATTEEFWYRSVDGFRIQGWIVKPPNFDPAKKYPMMLEIHGGPHAMYNGGFNFARQDHAAKGYVILYTNPRGSTGYGSAFGNAIKNAYPGKDYDDLMAGVDTVIGRGYVDSRNMFVFGCSGGGVLTAWIVGKTDRFAAASSNCPVVNWMSFVGTTDGSGWYYNFEKRPWEDPTEHLKRSPLMYVGNVKTPTMLMTGVLDLRTPISQTEEFYEALKFRKVPTLMVRFNEEYHGTSSKPSNYLRTQLYLRAWFDRYSRKDATAAAMDE